MTLCFKNLVPTFIVFNLLTFMPEGLSGRIEMHANLTGGFCDAMYVEKGINVDCIYGDSTQQIGDGVSIRSIRRGEDKKTTVVNGQVSSSTKVEGVNLVIIDRNGQVREEYVRGNGRLELKDVQNSQYLSNGLLDAMERQGIETDIADHVQIKARGIHLADSTNFFPSGRPGLPGQTGTPMTDNPRFFDDDHPFNEHKISCAWENGPDTFTCNGKKICMGHIRCITNYKYETIYNNGNCLAQHSGHDGCPTATECFRNRESAPIKLEPDNSIIGFARGIHEVSNQDKRDSRNNNNNSSGSAQ